MDDAHPSVWKAAPNRNFLLLLGPGVVLTALGCALWAFPFVGLFAPIVLMPGLVCIALAAGARGWGCLMMGFALLYPAWVGAATAVAESEQALYAQRLDYAQRNPGVQAPSAPAPAPLRRFVHWAVAPSLLAWLAWMAGKPRPAAEVALVWVGAFAVFPLAMAAVRVLSLFLPLTA